MATTLQIDLQSNPEIADLFADSQPGDKVELYTSIQAMDEQTLTLTLESACKGDEEQTEKKGEPDETEGSDKQEAKAGMGNATPGTERDVNLVANPTATPRGY